MFRMSGKKNLVIVPFYHLTTLLSSPGIFDHLDTCSHKERVPRKNSPENMLALFSSSSLSTCERKNNVPCLKTPLSDVTRGRLSRQAFALPSETASLCCLFPFFLFFSTTLPKKIALQSFRFSRKLTGARKQRAKYSVFLKVWRAFSG